MTSARPSLAFPYTPPPTSGERENWSSSIDKYTVGTRISTDVVVLRARLSFRSRESGQIPIIISFLTRQEFYGVLIGLVMYGGAWLPLLAGCLERPKTCLCRTHPNLCSSLGALLLSMQYKSLMGIWPDSLLPSESLACDTTDISFFGLHYQVFWLRSE